MVPQPTFVRKVSVHDEKRANRSIVVRYFRNPAEGPNQKPTVVYVPGFMSHGKAVKSEYVSDLCFKKKFNFVCYDPEGLGESPGDHATLEFSDWFDDCQAAIQVATEENPDSGIVLVGSSMGAWISLKMVEQNRELIKGLVLIAPAINFMWSFYLNWYNQCDEESQRKLEAGESVTVSTEYGDRIARKAFAVKSRTMELDTSKSIEVSCPVRILHGVEDDVIPFERSMKLMELLTSNDVDLTYRKRGGHRLAEQNDLKLLSQTLDSLMQQL